jgi:Trp operon repressor
VNNSFDEQLKELVTIRKLLILGLLRSGMSQTQVGAALGVHGTTIGRMFPTGALSESQKKPGKKKADEARAVGAG